MADQRITKRLIDELKVQSREYTIWDPKLPGFGARVRPSGAMSYIVVYRAGSGRGAPFRRFTVAAVSKTTPDEARQRAKIILGAVADGRDPAGDKASERRVPTISELADRFMAEHVQPKRKRGTAAFYKHILDKLVGPELGSVRADKVTSAVIAKLHGKLVPTPFQANRMLAVVGSMYAFASRVGILNEGTNPARRIEKFPEHRRERFLTCDELERLGAAIREAETNGIPWKVDEAKPNAKHLARQGNRFTKLDPFAAAALRLLLFTGCRLREILHLKWEHVDLERGLLFLPDSKTGRKTVVLNAPAVAVLTRLDRLGSYVIPGQTQKKPDPGSLRQTTVIAFLLADNPERPRADLKRPWEAVAKRAGLDGVRIHDLRHTFASFGAGSGLGLPIIGKLLGHTQSVTTARYAHLDNDPLRRASESIAGRIAEAMGEGSAGQGDQVVQLRKPGGAA
jgi:integrase